MKKLLFVVLVFIGFNVNAQSQANVEKKLFSVNFLLPGLEYEMGLSNNTTLDLRAGTGFGISGGSNRDTEFGIFLNAHTQYRYYYNFDKRLGKNKNIDNNSANYIALNGSIDFGDPIIGDLQLSSDFGGVIGPVWGLQRYYGSGFKLDLNLGAGYGFNNLGGSYLSPIIGLRLGWLLSK
ncbi:hypothetical protein [Gillisia limnaea]|uniref:Secreted protein n=1 Tax=Gillisia limnaea (strain DSM 15749 / LMG 21470 / R-8282) TaxID=865937 RepID=H2BYB7_GILLR|nr:hypothetical protein [Gillisia limnaea]EHQ02209.1 secreted protein [Gillisia limnaea DSM 15749]